MSYYDEESSQGEEKKISVNEDDGIDDGEPADKHKTNISNTNNNNNNNDFYYNDIDYNNSNNNYINNNNSNSLELTEETRMHHSNTDPELSIEVLDTVVDELWNKIGLFPPERGGFLLGSYQQNKCVIEHFIHDSEASTSGCIFTPSPEATELVQHACQHSGLSFLGVIHSHPAGLDVPSGGDISAIASVLNHNGQMPFVLAPIISSRFNNSQLDQHEMLFPQSQQIKLSFYAKRRNAPTLQLPQITRAKSNFSFSVAQQIEVGELCAKFRSNINWNTWSLSRINLDGSEKLCCEFVGPDNSNCFIIFSDGQVCNPQIAHVSGVLDQETIQNKLHLCFPSHSNEIAALSMGPRTNKTRKVGSTLVKQNKRKAVSPISKNQHGKKVTLTFKSVEDAKEYCQNQQIERS